MNFYKDNRSKIKIYWSKDKNKWNLKNLYSKLKGKNVYITFDVDALDVSIMPATGTPEPGGLCGKKSCQLLKKYAKYRRSLELI